MASSQEIKRRRLIGSNGDEEGEAAIECLDGTASQRLLPVWPIPGPKMISVSFCYEKIVIIDCKLDVQTCLPLIHTLNTKNVKFLHLSGVHIPEGCVKLFRRTLCNNKTIETLILGHIFPWSSQCLHDIVAKNNTIKRLAFLKGEIFDFTILAKAFLANKESQIDKLIISNIFTLTDDLYSVHSLLSAICTRPLRLLDLTDFFKEFALSEFPACPTLEYLDLSNVRHFVDIQPIKSFQNILGIGALRILNLTKFPFERKEVFAAFCDCLAQNKSLLALNLSSCEISDDFMLTDLIPALESHSTLETLDLSKNFITKTSIESLCKYLMRPENPLQKLMISENQLKNKGLRMLADSFANLEQLNVRDGDYGYPAVEYFCERTLYAKHLTEVSISQFHIVSAIDKMRKNLLRNKANKVLRERTLFQLLIGHDKLIKYISL